MGNLQVGYGSLIVAGNNFENVIYSFRSPGDRSAYGVLSGNEQALTAAAEASNVVLQLEDGKTVHINVFETSKVRALFRLRDDVSFV